MSIHNCNCCVVGCTSRKGKNPELSFHQFPKENKSFVTYKNKIGLEEKMDKRKAWFHAIKAPTEVSQSMRICSRHFTRTDFILPDMPALKRRLKKTAIPSIHLPNDTDEHENMKRKYKKTSPQNFPDYGSNKPIQEQTPTSYMEKLATTISDDELFAVEALLLLKTV